jgi:hypothetical protein
LFVPSYLPENRVMKTSSGKRREWIAVPAVVDLDESLAESYDYFWMLRLGIITKHTQHGWLMFRDGYRRISEERRRAAEQPHEEAC